jgi:hypothetical protein
MARPLAEYFSQVSAADVHAYGYGEQCDYLEGPVEALSYDWVITNPPFKLAEEFIHRSLKVARVGVAILARTVFLESVGRFNNIYTKYPPSVFAQFTERVPMVRGRVDKKASTATGYAWFVWEKSAAGTNPRLSWVPPCRKSLERLNDYD